MTTTDLRTTVQALVADGKGIWRLTRPSRP